MTSVRPMGTRHVVINHKSYLLMPTTVDVREPESDPVPQEASYARVTTLETGTFNVPQHSGQNHPTLGFGIKTDLGL